MNEKNKKILLRVLIVLVLVVCIIILARIGLFSKCDASKLKVYINSFGKLGPIIYVVMFTLIPLTLFPDSILAISGGMAFGTLYGTLYTIIGAIFGAVLSFYIARFLGRCIVEKIIGKRAKYFEDGVENKGFILILILRLIPLVPFDVISYGAGLSKINFKDFFMATLVGIIPGVVVFNNFGDKCFKINSPQFLIAVVLLLMLFAISYFFKKKLSLIFLKKSIFKKN